MEEMLWCCSFCGSNRPFILTVITPPLLFLLHGTPRWLPESLGIPCVPYLGVFSSLGICSMIRLRHVRSKNFSLDDSTADINESKTRQGIRSFVKFCFLLLFRSSNVGIWLIENPYVVWWFDQIRALSTLASIQQWKLFFTDSGNITVGQQVLSLIRSRRGDGLSWSGRCITYESGLRRTARILIDHMKLRRE